MSGMGAVGGRLYAVQSAVCRRNRTVSTVGGSWRGLSLRVGSLSRRILRGEFGT